jgi:hypothetical protein
MGGGHGFSIRVPFCRKLSVDTPMDEDTKEVMKIAAEAALQPVTKVIGDAVGVLGGDRLAELRERQRARRAKRNAETTERAQQLLEERKVKEPSDVNEETVVQLLEAAQDEGRSELKEIWAKLLAAMFDPERSPLFRQEFIGIAKQLEPVDTAILQQIIIPGPQADGRLEWVSRTLHLDTDVVANSFRNLGRLGLSDNEGSPTFKPIASALGRQFLASVK